MRIFPIIACTCCLLLAACNGSSPEGTLDPVPPSERQTPVHSDKIEIPLGSPVSRVLDALGPADSTETWEGGREVWRYSRKKADYVYASKSGGGQTLVIGKYVREPQPESPGQPLLLTIVFDPAKKVVDFNFSLMGF
ncbi:MAG: hypothetical protein LIP28_03425 [Deltaproteobacteria bacterium]|nr:hypothetical protein [Deltaproteobacteria bacterium]